jgi:hypothetical protein
MEVVNNMTGHSIIKLDQNRTFADYYGFRRTSTILPKMELLTSSSYYMEQNTPSKLAPLRSVKAGLRLSRPALPRPRTQLRASRAAKVIKSNMPR